MAETISRRSMDIVSKDSLRKSKKPLMEKRRRLRINTCLNQLKTLVLQALNKDGSHFSKLEKADILEMTVKYLRGVQRTQISGQIQANPTAQAAKYRAGFNECANEVVRYVHAVHGVNDEIRSRLMGHLANCMHVVNAPSEAQPTRVPLQPLYVQVPSGGVPQQNLSSTVSAAAARQNMLLWGQQAELRALGPLVSVPPSGASSPPFVSPYSQGSPVSRSPSPRSSIPSPSNSDMSSGSDMGSRLSPRSPYQMPAKPELARMYPQPMAQAHSLKCKEEDVWRPW